MESRFGIDYLKCIAVSIMISNHCIGWLQGNVHFSYVGSHPRDSLISIGQVLALFNLMIPLLAGASLRLRFDSQIKGEKLKKSALKSVLVISFFLIFLEVIQNLFLKFSFVDSFITWNVLHLIGLSFLIISVISIYNIKWLWLIFSFVIISKSVKKFAKELNIKLVYLPPYSPNLNPIERLWKFMKKEVTANRYYENYDDFKGSLSQFFRGIRKHRSKLETLITDNFSILGN